MQTDLWIIISKIKRRFTHEREKYERPDYQTYIKRIETRVAELKALEIENNDIDVVEDNKKKKYFLTLIKISDKEPKIKIIMMLMYEAQLNYEQAKSTIDNLPYTFEYKDCEFLLQNTLNSFKYIGAEVVLEIREYEGY